MLLARAVMVLLMVLPCAMSAPEVSAFDGQRKGFTIGFHLGYARVNHSKPARDAYLFQRDSTGAITDTILHVHNTGLWDTDGGTGQMKLGYGFSESILVNITTQFDLEGTAIVYSSAYGSHSNVAGSTTTLALDYYPGGVGGKWYAGAGIGTSSIGDVRGPAYRVSIGRDLWGIAQLEATVSRYGTADRHNVAARIMFGWLWR